MIRTLKSSVKRMIAKLLASPTMAQDSMASPLSRTSPSSPEASILGDQPTSLLDSYELLHEGPLADELFIRLRIKIYGRLDRHPRPYHREFGRLASGASYFFVQPFNEKGWLFESQRGGWILSKAAKIYGEATFIREGTPLEQAQLRLPPLGRSSVGGMPRLVYPRVATEIFQETGMALALYETKLAEFLVTLLDPLSPATPVQAGGLGARMSTVLLILAVLPVISGRILAGPYLTAGVRSGQFAAKPLTDEPTPNYYGFGLKLSGGYSLRQVFDMGLYASGLPARRGSPGISNPDALLAHGGLELALRLGKSVILAAYGGQSQYRLQHPSEQLPVGVEVTAPLKGYGGGVSVGAIVPFSKEQFLQATLDFEQHQYLLAQPEGNTKRVFESFGLTLAMTFNSYKSYLIDNTIFKDFLDSMNF